MVQKTIAAIYVSVLPMFSSVIPWSLIHFEFFFVYSLRKCSIFILLHVAVHYTSTACWRDSSFLHFCLLCCKLIDHSAWVYFWASLLFHWYLSGFVPASCCFGYCNFECSLILDKYFRIRYKLPFLKLQLNFLSGNYIEFKAYSPFVLFIP